MAGSNSANTAAELAQLYSNWGNTSLMRDIRRGQAFGVRAMPGYDFLTGIGVPVSLAGK